MSMSRSIFKSAQSYGSLSGFPDSAPVPLLSVNNPSESIEVVSLVSMPVSNKHFEMLSGAFSFLDIESLITINKMNKESHRLVADRIKALEQLQIKSINILQLRRLEKRKNSISKLDACFKEMSNRSVRLQTQILKNAIHYIHKNIFIIPAEQILLPSSPVDLMVRPEAAAEEKAVAHVIDLSPVVRSDHDDACVEELKFFGAAIRDILSVYKRIDEKTGNSSVAKNIKNLFLIKLKEKYFYLQYSVGFDVTAGGVDIRNLMDLHSSVRDVFRQNRKNKAYNLLYGSLALALYFILDEVPMNKLLSYGIFLVTILLIIASFKGDKKYPDTDIQANIYLNRNLLFTASGNQRLLRLVSQANAEHSALAETKNQDDVSQTPRPA